MGHMDDENEKQTIRIFGEDRNQTFHECTEIDTNGSELVFRDKGGNRHQFYGVAYEITQD